MRLHRYVTNIFGYNYHIIIKRRWPVIGVDCFYMFVIHLWFRKGDDVGYLLKSEPVLVQQRV